VKKLHVEKNLASQFKESPQHVVQSIIGRSIPKGVLDQVINGVKAKLSVDQADDLLDQAKSLFKK